MTETFATTMKLVTTMIIGIQQFWVWKKKKKKKIKHSDTQSS